MWADGCLTPWGTMMDKTAIVVLGMHRSGTSSLAGALTRLGAGAPKTLMAASPSNERGHYESNVLVQINDRLLAAAGSAWDDWRSLAIEALPDALVENFTAEAVAALADEYGEANLIVFKDPRVCRMMRFWRRAFADSGYAIRAILPVRSPLEVAQSLADRNGFPLGKGLLLWLRHVLDAEVESRDLPRGVTLWSEFLLDWRQSVKSLGERIGVDLTGAPDQAAEAVDAYLSASLRHQTVHEEALAVHPDVHEWVLKTYRAMIMLAADPVSEEARRDLDIVRSEFSKASGVFGSMFADYDVLLSELRRQLEAEKAQSEQRRIALASSEAEAQAQRRSSDDAAMAMRALVSDNAALQRGLDEVKAEMALRAARASHEAAYLREMQAALAQEMAKMRSERDSALQGLEQQLADARDERNHVVATFEGELQSLEQQLADARRQRDDLAARLERELTDVRDERNHEVATLEGELVNARRVRDELVAKIAQENARQAVAPDLTTRLLRRTAIPPLSRLAEARQVARLKALKFDAAYYLAAHDDVRQNGMCAYRHFIRHGVREGRAHRFAD